MKCFLKKEFNPFHSDSQNKIIFVYIFSAAQVAEKTTSNCHATITQPKTHLPFPPQIVDIKKLLSKNID